MIIDVLVCKPDGTQHLEQQEVREAQAKEATSPETH